MRIRDFLQYSGCNLRYISTMMDEDMMGKVKLLVQKKVLQKGLDIFVRRT